MKLRVQENKLPPLPSILDLLKLYNVKAIKKLSQNFLVGKKWIQKIVHAGLNIENGFVCEVGPGPGGITRSIIDQDPHTLLLVEKDTRFEPMLQELQNAAKNICSLKVAYADVLDFKMAPFVDESFKRKWTDPPPNIHIIGNLPFNVSTILIIRWLKDISLKENAWSCGRVKMTLTFQKEVAERMVAPILAKNRCRLSVMCQNWCEVKHAFTIPGKAFVPKPEVDVGVVRFKPLIRPAIDLDFYLIEKVLRTGFSTRQKYIKSSLKNLFPLVRKDVLVDELLRKSEINGQMRSFQLTVEEWGRICHAYKQICDENQSIYSYNYRESRNLREIENVLF